MVRLDRARRYWLSVCSADEPGAGAQRSVLILMFDLRHEIVELEAPAISGAERSFQHIC